MDEVNLGKAIEICSQLSGHLPIVHSQEDIDSLPLVDNIWLGAKKNNKISPRGLIYEWLDASPFNFTKWDEGNPNCTSSCCGVSLESRPNRIHGQRFLSNRSFVDIPCTEERDVICELSFLSKEAAQKLVEGTVNEAFANSSIRLMEQQFAIAILNDTLADVLEATKPLYEEFQEHLVKERLQQEEVRRQRLMIASLNRTVTRLKLGQDQVASGILNQSLSWLQQHAGPLKETLKSQETLLGQLNETILSLQSSKLDSSPFARRVNICLAILIVMIVVEIAIVMVRYNVFSTVGERLNLYLFNRWTRIR